MVVTLRERGLEGGARPLRVRLPKPGESVRVELRLSGGGKAWIALSADRRALEVELVEPARADVLGALSPREREVATLVARGLGNREVAGELGLRPATVATHLVRTYRKLGIFGRYELSRLVLGASPVRAPRPEAAPRPRWDPRGAGP